MVKINNKLDKYVKREYTSIWGVLYEIVNII